MSEQSCPECQKVTGGCLEHSSFRTYGSGQTPHCCPVCGGRGTVQPGFYSPFGLMGNLDITPEPCRSCNGSGVLWR